jgi:pyruvyltransferase
MPKNVEKQYTCSVVKHMSDHTKTNLHEIDILTNDYSFFIDELVASEFVISSSLHGIILSEAYGIPCVLYLPKDTNNTLFKYEDYYYSTGRYDFPVAKTIEEALKTTPPELPDLRELQKKSFG